MHSVATALTESAEAQEHITGLMLQNVILK
jgi:hypothetical protein